MARDRRPPGPAGNWLLGNAGLLRRDILKLLEDVPRQYGDVVRLRFGPYHTVLLSHPSGVEQVLGTQGKKFDKPPRFLRIVRPALGDGLLTSRGDAWRRQRRRIQSLLDALDLDDHCRAVVQCVQRTIATWGDAEENDLAGRMMTLALAERAKTTLGIDRTQAFESIYDALREFLDYYASSLRSPFTWPLWVPIGSNRRKRSALKRWSAAIEDQIERTAQSEHEGRHLLAGLLQLGRSHSEFAMTRRQLRDELATWLMTGTETSANTLAWACYALARNTEQQNKLFEEVQSTLRGQLPQREDLAKLQSVEHTLLETLRLYPQGYVIGRKAHEPFDIENYHFPKNTTVMLNQWFIHRDPRWFDDPDEFMPDRWSGDRLGQLHRFAYFPFGGGARICIGRSLAMLELPLILAILVQRFHFALPQDALVRPVPSMTLRPVWDRGAIRISRR